MEKALVKKSDFLKVKYKFFINRILIYFSFLCIPIWIQKTLDMNLVVQSTILVTYMLFMGGQWYLLGKELDHRLKIYYRANSSLERIVYRVVMGSVLMLLLFNLFALFPSTWVSYLFWIFFSIVGIFYSWPTRGKIIEETMVGQFGEIKFLDSFEKTVLTLSLLTFVISLPEIPLFQNIEALKLYFDSNEQVSVLFWNFLTVLYSPFSQYPKLYNLIWSFHFYFIGLGIFLLTIYSLLRYFYSRRLSILGIFAILSTWSFSRILADDYFASISTTTSVLWVWSIMWSTRSGTYRSGLFTGLVGAYLCMINAINIVLIPVGLFFTYKLFLKEKTGWFKKQWLKYNLLGLFISLLIFLNEIKYIDIAFNNIDVLLNSTIDSIYKKAFFTIAPIGIILSLIYRGTKSRLLFTYVNFDKNKFNEVLFGIASIVLMGIFVLPDMLRGFSIIWILAFFSLIPIEWIFQSISRLRSKRNIIYVMYILVCLLDSHLESRFRIIGKMFLEIESFKYFIQL